MKNLPAGEDPSKNSATGSSNAVITCNRKAAEGEDRQSRYNTGDAEFLVMVGLRAT
jgi:hypothetical protein